MASIKLNIYDAKKHLSRHLSEMTEADRLILCSRNQPVAEVRRLPQHRTEPRRLGVAKGEFAVPAAFLEPLPQELLDAFEGRG